MRKLAEVRDVDFNKKELFGEPLLQQKSAKLLPPTQKMRCPLKRNQVLKGKFIEPKHHFSGARAMLVFMGGVYSVFESWILGEGKFRAPPHQQRHLKKNCPKRRIHGTMADLPIPWRIHVTGMSTYIDHKNQPNVGKYTIPWMVWVYINNWPFMGNSLHRSYEIEQI